jgi:hypothetical protein
MSTFSNTFSNTFGSIQLGAQLKQDDDAEAFFYAANITDETQKSAVTDFCLNAKKNGYWNKIVAAYPIVGGTADQHKYNLKNPQDTNAAFRLTYQGTIQHDANGLKSTSGGRIQTYVDPALFSGYWGCLSYRDDGNTGVAWGVTSPNYDYPVGQQFQYQGNGLTTPKKYFDGCVGITRENINHADFILNNIPASDAAPNINATTGTVTINHHNDGNIGNYQHKFFAVYDGLTKAELQLFCYDVMVFQTELSRGMSVTTTTYTVASSGGDYTSLRDAIKACIDADYYNRYVINVANGTYNEIDVYIPSTSYVGYDSDIIKIIGQSRDETIIYLDGESTDNSPSDYQYGSYGSQAINTIPKTNKHLIWLQGSVTFQDITLHGKECQYVIHSDSYDQTALSKFNNVKLVHEENNTHQYSVIGYGAQLDQRTEFVNCVFEYRTTLLTANDAWGVFWHNRSGGNGGDCSFLIQGCEFINCGFIWTNEANSGFDDLVEIENCSTDTDAKAIKYSSSNAANGYNINIEVTNCGIDNSNVVLEDRPNGLDYVTFN